MKKLVLFMAVATAIAFASCGEKAEENTEATDSVPTTEVQEPAEEPAEDINAEEVPADAAAEDAAATEAE